MGERAGAEAISLTLFEVSSQHHCHMMENVSYFEHFGQGLPRVLVNLEISL